MPFIRTLSAEGRKRLCIGLGGAAAILLITLGVFASNDWLPKTDPMTGKRFGWFGKPLAKNAPSSWNPVAAVLPSPTPTPLPLSKGLADGGLPRKRPAEEHVLLLAHHPVPGLLIERAATCNKGRMGPIQRMPAGPEAICLFPAQKPEASQTQDV